MPKQRPDPLRPEEAASLWNWLVHGSHRIRNAIAIVVTLGHAATSTVAAYFLKDLDHVALFIKLRVVLYGGQAVAIGTLLCLIAFVLRPPHMPDMSHANEQADYFYRRWLWLWGVWMLLYFGLFAFHWGLAPQAIAMRRLEWTLEEQYAKADTTAAIALESSDRHATLDGAVRDSLRRTRDDLALAAKTHSYVPLWGMGDGRRAATVDSVSRRLVEARARMASTMKWTQAIFDTLNNLQTFILLLCFFWLDRASRRLDEDLNMEPLTTGIIGVVVLAFAEYAVVMGGEAGRPAGEFLRWMSGIASGVAMALLVERVSGAIIGTPKWVMLVLMGYAIIQAAWGAFEDNASLMLVLTSIALILKLILFIVVAWLLDTGVLLFYYKKRYEFGEKVEGGRKRIEQERVVFVEAYLKAKRERT